ESITHCARKENGRVDDPPLLPEKRKNTILCADCEELLRYAHARLDHCPFGEKKSACKECTVHCYKPVMRERMRQVMRFSGPRMLLYAPWQAIRHLLNL
ncbi:LOW QUALITY PROTEIN: putative cytoplasmic protein, partial [Bacteroides sp. 3_1_23]